MNPKINFERGNYKVGENINFGPLSIHFNVDSSSFNTQY